MGFESSLRSWAHRHGLQSWRPVVAAYRTVSTVRYRTAWERPVDFRGARFVIGKDLSLFPAVHNGGFEQEELDALLPLVHPGDTVWDVGGNVGIYAVLLARTQPGVQVVSFEPVPTTRARLEANLALNATDNVTIESHALSSSAGSARMVVHPDAPGCDQVTTEDAPVEGDASIIAVSTITGDVYAAGSPAGDPQLIKVDIEGHEPEFVDGARGLIERARPTLMLEVNPSAWGSGRTVVWTRTLDWLFDVYGHALWFEPSGSRTISSLDVTSLGEHAYTVIFTGARAA